MKDLCFKCRIRSVALALAGAGLLGAANTSRAAVTIYFEQVGSSVLISAAGTLDIQPERAFGPHTHSFGEMSHSRVYRFHGSDPYIQTNNSGVATPTGLSPLNEGSTTGDGAFGFKDTQLRFLESNISAGTAGSVSQITWDPASSYWQIFNTSLAALGADNLQNTLAWTANGTGDTISLQTGPPPAPIPEPSAAALFGLGACALLARRRRGSRAR